MSVQFTYPQWLWLLPVAWAWVVWLALNSQVNCAPSRRWTALTIRAFITLTIILALAGVQWMEAVEGMNVMFLVDRSDSLPAQQQEFARNWIDAVGNDKQPTDRAGVIVFGTDASIETSAAHVLKLPKIEAVVPTDRTDIGGAIRLGLATFPQFGQRRLVLISDGNENVGDTLSAVASARALETSIDVVPLDVSKKSDISIQRLWLPSSIQKGQTFEAKVFVQADQPGPATLRLYRNERFLGQQMVQLEAGKNLFTFPQTLSERGFYSYDARIDAASDRIPQNNRATAFTQVRGIPRVLLISSDLEADAPLAEALHSSDFDIKLSGVSAFPDSLAEIQSYDAVLLCNVLAGDLSREQLTQMETAVRDFGTGFVCIGGDQAYAAGAYRGTPLADILPIEVELSSKKVLPPGALMLVIDQSGSMMGEKLEMARQAAAAAVQALAATDYAGVIAFDGEPHVVAPLRPVGDRRELIRGIMDIGVGGGTVMYPAMVRAHEMLGSTKASFKHCVVLTDGVSAPGDFENITKKMAADRITVSTVGIGQDIDGNLLQTIAALGKGRFYPVPFPVNSLKSSSRKPRWC